MFLPLIDHCASVVARAGRAPVRTRCEVTRRTPRAPSAVTFAIAGSRPSSPSPTTRKGTANDADHAAAVLWLDAADYRNRNVIERGYCRIKQWRGLATRYDKHAVIYRAAVVLNAVIAWTKALS